MPPTAPASTEVTQLPGYPLVIYSEGVLACESAHCGTSEHLTPDTGEDGRWAGTPVPGWLVDFQGLRRCPSCVATLAASPYTPAPQDGAEIIRPQWALTGWLAERTAYDSDGNATDVAFTRAARVTPIRKRTAKAAQGTAPGGDAA